MFMGCSWEVILTVEKDAVSRGLCQRKKLLRPARETASPTASGLPSQQFLW